MQLQALCDGAPLWVFNEIHKYKNWRNYLKGVYDQISMEGEKDYLSKNGVRVCPALKFLSTLV